MDNSSNIFSYFVGALALVSALVSTILYYQTYLPSVQMKILDELLQETKEIYDKADADGLLPTSEVFRTTVQHRFTILQSASEQLRQRTYCATTVADEYLELMRGLSRKIMQTAGYVKKLRAFFITTSEEKRRRLAISSLRAQAGLSSNSATAAPVAASVHDDASTVAPVPPFNATFFETSISTDVDSPPRSRPPSLDHTILALTTDQPIAIPDLPSISSDTHQPSACTEADIVSLSSTLVPEKNPHQYWSIPRALRLFRQWISFHAPRRVSNLDADSIDTLPV